MTRTRRRLLEYGAAILAGRGRDGFAGSGWGLGRFVLRPGGPGTSRADEGGRGEERSKRGEHRDKSSEMGVR